jgi:hypothetical protein
MDSNRIYISSQVAIEKNIANGEYHHTMSKTAPPSRTAPQFVVRLPDEVFRDQIAEAAKTNNRSMNAEIVARLQASFESAPSVDGTVAQELADSRAQTITAMEFLQGSLCETIVAMYASLPASQKRDRTLVNAQRLAGSLLAGARPGDYLLSRSELLAANHALVRFLEEVEADIEAHRKKEARTGRTGSAKR